MSCHPGGRLGLVWNIRDEREGWVAELGQILHRGIDQDMTSSNPKVGPPFAPIERFDVEWIHHLTRTALLDLVASRSYVITLPAEERSAVLAAVQDLLDTHPALAGRPDLAMPYVTHCSRAHLV